MNETADPLDLIAAQYVLGVLSVPARERVQTRMLREPQLRDLVYAWERKLNPLAQLLTPQDVPDQVWQAIHTRIAPTNQQVKPSASLTRWRWSTGISVALAASLAMFLVAHPSKLLPQPSAPMVITPAIQDVAVLSTNDHVPTWIVRRQDQRWILSSLSIDTTPSRHDFELWRVEGSQAPRSLGVLQLKQGQAVVSPTLMQQLTKNSVLAISLEPVGGSTTGQPTGPVMYTGKVARL